MSNQTAESPGRFVPKDRFLSTLFIRLFLIVAGFYVVGFPALILMSILARDEAWSRDLTPNPATFALFWIACVLSLLAYRVLDLIHSANHVGLAADEIRAVLARIDHAAAAAAPAADLTARAALGANSEQNERIVAALVQIRDINYHHMKLAQGKSDDAARDNNAGDGASQDIVVRPSERTGPHENVRG